MTLLCAGYVTTDFLRCLHYQTDDDYDHDYDHGKMLKFLFSSCITIITQTVLTSNFLAPLTLLIISYCLNTISSPYKIQGKKLNSKGKKPNSREIRAAEETNT